MQKRKYAVYGIASLWIAICAGCSGGGSTNGGSGGTGDSVQRLDGPPIELSDYVRTETSNNYGFAERFTIRPDAFAREKADLSGRQVRLLGAGNDLNTRSYHLEGYEHPGIVLLEPRVFLRGSPGVGAMQFREGRSGNVLVDVSIALVDGLSSTVFTGRGVQTLPPEFLVKDRDMLLRDITKEVKQAPVFVASVPCPKALKVRARGAELPVAIQTPLKSCPLNTFFPGVMSFKRGEWESMALSLIEDGAIELQMKLDLTVPLTTEYAHFKLKKEQMLRAMEKAISGKTVLLSEEEVTKALVTIVDAIESAFEFEAPEAFYAQLRDQFLNDYFMPVEKPNCPSDLAVCYGKRGNWSVPQVGEYTVVVRREEYFGKPVTITSETSVSDSAGDRQEVLISAGNENPLEPPKHGELSQVFRTVHDGEVLELKFRQAGFGEVSFSEPKMDRISNQVCVEPYTKCLEGRWSCTNPNSESYNCRNVCNSWRDVCGQSHRECVERGVGLCFFCCDHVADICDRWERQCAGTYQVCDTRRVCDRLAAPAMPTLPYRTDKVSPTAPDFAWECGNYAQNQCDPDKWEDQWQRVTTWSLPVVAPQLRIQGFKPELWENVVAGLGIRFRWAAVNGVGNGAGDGAGTVTCAVTDLEHRVLPPDRLIIVLRNTDKCRAFNEENRKPGFAPSIGFINQIEFPAKFQCGTLWENWKGERAYTCRLPDGSETSLNTSVAEDEQRLARGEKLGIQKTYFPRVELQGRLRIVGSRLESIGGTK